MGFLNWFGKQEEETSQESQLELFGSSSALRERVDGAIVRKEFSKTVDEKGGTDETQAYATEAMTREIFGCSTEDLYKETKARPGRRQTLPQDAQTAYIVGEVAATHKLKGTEIGGNQSQKHERIVDTVEQSAREVKGIFPWNW